MADSPNDPLTPQSLQQQVKHYNLAMLYYGFFVVATAAIVLAIYHCLIIKWFADHGDRPLWSGAGGPPSAQGSDGQKIVRLASTTYKYKKGQEGSDECVVCLSMFEEEEDIRELPRCKHSFHAPCIDTWLSSHLDCPICRASVADRTDKTGAPPENSSVGFSVPISLV